jgi:hypothetical protein
MTKSMASRTPTVEATTEQLLSPKEKIVPESKKAKQLVATMFYKKRLGVDEEYVMQQPIGNDDSLSDRLIDEDFDMAKAVKHDSISEMTDKSSQVIVPLKFTECYPLVPPEIFDTYGKKKLGTTY